MYQDIFIEIGKTNVKSIIDCQETQILDILLDLMGIGCQESNVIEETFQEKIRGRY